MRDLIFNIMGIYNILNKTMKALTAIMTVIIIHSCIGKDSGYIFPDLDSDPAPQGDREYTQLKRHTFIMFSLGHNNLASELEEDIKELKQGLVPGNGTDDDVLLVFSHRKYSQSTDPRNAPLLQRIYRLPDGQTICDTLKTWSLSTISADPATISEVFDYVVKEFPSADYGALFSSHATGYLPEGFYSKPDNYIFPGDNQPLYRGGRPRGVPYVEIPRQENEPMVKSCGQDVQGSLSYEIEIQDFANAIPIKLSYMLFDACFMGGIEVAYELKDKCDMIGFSQTEVLSNGFLYTQLGDHIFGNDGPTPQKVCEDYFNSYDIQTGVFRSATISMVDCNRLEPLAQVCNRLFEKYRNTLDTLDPSIIQRYYRYKYHWFYDLQSIVENLGATQEEVEEFMSALNDCIIYKGATPSFLEGASGFKIDTFSGLSMYLPSDGHTELSKYYKTLQWNKITGLVR